MQKLVIASGNLGKIKEFQAILSNYDLIKQIDFNTPEVVESGLSFVENAILKARNAAKFSNLPAIADDSGLCVDGLGGNPGIYSARYSGGDDEDNIDKLLQKLQGVKNRSASFYCAIAMVKSFDDPTPVIATANWEGVILTTRVGKNGFGYDSIFFVPEFGKSSAELLSQEKNQISHRAKALRQLTKLL